jgi:hypothetical protein
VVEVTFLQEDLYRFLGHDIGIRSNSHEVLAHLKSVYGRFYKGSNEVLSNYRDKRESTCWLRIEVIDQLESSNEILLTDPYDSHRLICRNLYAFDEGYYTSKIDLDPLGYIQGIVQRDISLIAKDYFPIHAGAVSWADEGVIMPASSGLGKTTLTVKLVTRGFKFLSDEVACLDLKQETIAPFFRKLKLEDESRRLLGLPSWTNINTPLIKRGEVEWMLDIEDIVPDSLSNPVPLRYVLFLRGFGERPRLEYIASSNALFELLKFSMSPVDDPAFLLFQLAPLLNGIQCFNLIVGELDETAELVMQLTELGKWQDG